MAPREEDRAVNGDGTESHMVGRNILRPDRSVNWSGGVLVVEGMSFSYK